jgi:hypothetical protein
VVAAPGASFSNAASVALHYAAIYLGNLITDPIAVTIQANVSNLNSTTTTGILAYGSAEGYFENFKTIRQEIALHDPSVAKYLPTTLPSGVYTSIVASKSELQAWGLGYGAPSYSIGGSIVINTAYSSSFNYSTSINAHNANTGLTDFVGVAEHELSHALGRISYNGNTASLGGYLFGPLNLFRFDAPGKLQVDGMSSSSNATIPYFSLNDGKTDLISFASVSRTDWANPASGRYSNDSWDGYAPSSGYARLYNIDRSLLNAIGFDVVCFAAGAKILTSTGPVAVEHLAEGDEIVLHRGGTAPIKWIGHRHIDTTKHPKPDTVWPVLIEAGAILDGVPHRDLLVSPNHAFLLDDHLIPAKTLINGTTIRQVERKRITYYHIELPEHAAIYAEGTPTESYLDTGNRSFFENAGIAVSLHPDFSTAALAQQDRAQQSCAPFIEAGPLVEAIRARILARAAIATTNDPAILITKQADGSVILHSRHAIPGHLTPDPRDRRTLGVKIARISAGDADIPLNHPLLADGWHDPDHGGRWTNGRAIIPAALVAGCEITIEIIGSLAYPAPPQPAEKLNSGAPR